MSAVEQSVGQVLAPPGKRPVDVSVNVRALTDRQSNAALARATSQAGQTAAASAGHRRLQRAAVPAESGGAAEACALRADEV